MANDGNIEEKLETVVKMLISFSTGNFDVREEVTEDDTPLNSVISGLNMLGEELSYYMQEIENHNEFLNNIFSSIDEVLYVRSIVHEAPYFSPFSFITERVSSIIGFTAEMLHQEPDLWITAIHPEDKEKSFLAIKDILNGRDTVFVYRILHPVKQQYIWLEDRVVPRKNSDGIVTHVYGSVRDITANKTAELEREKLIAELNKRYSELMQFNYIVSHNLRSPVTSILGLAQLINTNLEEEELKVTTKFILDAAEAIDALLHDLNSILSTRSMLSERKEPFLIADVIQSVCNSLSMEIADTNAILTVDIDPAVAEITSIRTYIHSIFFNLIANAIKYREEGRQVIIKIKATEVDGRVVITVADNGSGIDLSLHREKIFSLYSRFHLNYEGKGLGLYMTKTQIETLGGTIKIESKEGEGTTFTITL